MLQKIAFSAFFVKCKNKNGFLSNFSPIVLCSNLFSKLVEIGEKMLKNPFSILQFSKKGWKSNFLEQNTNFFKTMLALLANISEPIPNLLGHFVRIASLTKYEVPSQHQLSPLFYFLSYRLKLHWFMMQFTFMPKRYMTSTDHKRSIPSHFPVMELKLGNMEIHWSITWNW